MHKDKRVFFSPYSWVKRTFHSKEPGDSPTKNHRGQPTTFKGLGHSMGMAIKVFGHILNTHINKLFHQSFTIQKHITNRPRAANKIPIQNIYYLFG